MLVCEDMSYTFDFDELGDESVETKNLNQLKAIGQAIPSGALVTFEGEEIKLNDKVIR